MEPILIVVLCLLGVLIELFIGNRAWRPLYKADGHFAEFHANNWQVGTTLQASAWGSSEWCSMS
jgi:hypothetical protein